MKMNGSENRPLIPGPDGEIYQSFTDDFGNTTTYGPDGEIYQSYTDDFGNTTIYGN